MGWCDSPAYFCAASETARDVADQLAETPTGSLPAHPLEGSLIRPQDWPERGHAQDNLGEVHPADIDDYVQLAGPNYRSR
jgi:hypothetical protein